MKRHFTVTAFVSAERQTLLHWHRKNRMWLPPGGHIEPDEDPYQAALREAEEEVGFPVVLLSTVAAYNYNQPRQLPPPVTIMVEDIPATPSEPEHQHLDLIYFARPQVANPPTPAGGTWRWVSSEALRDNHALTTSNDASPVAVPEDVRVLGMAAIQRAAEEAP
ncbi:MAG: NUDIX domain-containing protein [Chloroflexi bacterium]|nr:NUDIX domain-containing protein [Chloroflexota bacterium]